jgi:hypothetical protein
MRFSAVFTIPTHGAHQNPAITSVTLATVNSVKRSCHSKWYLSSVIPKNFFMILYLSFGFVDLEGKLILKGLSAYSMSFFGLIASGFPF